jgi:hypothetical protein
MSEPKIEILEAYKLEFSDDKIKQFIEESWGDALEENEKLEMLAAKREELASVVAFDVLVTDADETFSAGGFKQVASGQVAYDEVYLSLDGRSVESASKPKDLSRFRIYFFLHGVDSRKPLLSSYGELKIPNLKPLPDYLEQLHPFAPVD